MRSMAEAILCRDVGVTIRVPDAIVRIVVTLLISRDICLGS